MHCCTYIVLLKKVDNFLNTRKLETILINTFELSRFCKLTIKCYEVILEATLHPPSLVLHEFVTLVPCTHDHLEYHGRVLVIYATGSWQYTLRRQMSRRTLILQYELRFFFNSIVVRFSQLHQGLLCPTASWVSI